MGGEQKVAQHRAMQGWFAPQKMNTVSSVAQCSAMQGMVCPAKDEHCLKCNAGMVCTAEDECYLKGCSATAEEP